MTTYDVAIIGAGPAGMASAITLAQHGMQVVLVDENPNLGGQIYRNVGDCPIDGEKILGGEYVYGRTLTDQVQNAPNITHYHSTTVWNLECNDTNIHIYTTQSHTQTSIVCSARKIILANGAIERPMPINGWTKAGVVTVGGVQILLKTSGVVAENAVFIGSGPLLSLLVAQYIQAGVPVQCIIDTTSKGAYKNALAQLLDALRGWKVLLKGLKLIWKIRCAKIPYIRNATNIKITGGHVADGVSYDINGVSHHLQTDTVCIHQGVVPNINIAHAIGCDTVWDDSNSCWVVTVGNDFQTSVNGVYAVGDGVQIGGAKVAEYAGHETALYVAKALGYAVCESTLQTYAKHRKKATHARTFLNTLYAPNPTYTIPTGDTIVCRCEEKTADDVMRAISFGAQGPNQMKSFNRCGMGFCQGRYCGLTITQMIAHYTQTPPQTVGYYKLRAPFKPITVQQMSTHKKG